MKIDDLFLVKKTCRLSGYHLLFIHPPMKISLPGCDSEQIAVNSANGEG